MGNSCWNNNLSEMGYMKMCSVLLSIKNSLDKKNNEMEEQFNRISIFFPVTRKQNDIETLEEETVKKI